MDVRNLVLWLTEECVLRCSYCFVEKRPRRLSFEVGKQAIDFLLNPNVSGTSKQLRVGFFGGEPLLEFPLMRRIVEYATKAARRSNKRISFGITTNGVLLSEDVLRYLGERNIGVLFSIDGTPETMGSQRMFPDGRNSYSAATRHLKGLFRIQPRVTARMTVHPDRLDLVTNAQHLFELGFHNIAICPVAEAPWDDDDLETAFHHLARWYIDSARAGRLLRLNYTNRFLKRLADAARGKPRPLVPCGAGRGMLGVDVKGNVMPCHHWVDMNSFTLGTVWSGVSSNKRAPFLNYTSDSFKGCSSCEARPYCSGCCLANAAQRMGHMFHPVPGSCQFIKARLKAARLIYDTLLPEKNDVLLSVIRPKSKKPE